MEVLPTCCDLSHPLRHKSVRMPKYLPLRDYLVKLFGQISYQNVKDIKVNKGTTS